MEKKSRKKCTVEELQNDKASELTKKALRFDMEMEEYAGSKIPVEEFLVSINRVKVKRCVKHAVKRH